MKYDFNITLKKMINNMTIILSLFNETKIKNSLY